MPSNHSPLVAATHLSPDADADMAQRRRNCACVELSIGGFGSTSHVASAFAMPAPAIPSQPRKEGDHDRPTGSAAGMDEGARRFGARSGPHVYTGSGQGPAPARGR